MKTNLFRLNLRVLSAIALRVGLDTRTTCSGFRRLFGSVWSRMETVWRCAGVLEAVPQDGPGYHVRVFSGSWRGSGSVPGSLRISHWSEFLRDRRSHVGPSHGFKLSAALSPRNENLRNSEVLKCDLFHAVVFSHTHNWTFTSSELTCEFWAAGLRSAARQKPWPWVTHQVLVPAVRLSLRRAAFKINLWILIKACGIQRDGLCSADPGSAGSRSERGEPNVLRRVEDANWTELTSLSPQHANVSSLAVNSLKVFDEKLKKKTELPGAWEECN